MGNSKVTICIICSIDPFGPNISGIATFLKGFIKFSPENCDIMFIGITSEKNERPPGKMISLEIDNKKILFFPLFFEKNENIKSIIPLSLRFVVKLLFTKLDLQNRILIFNRIETAIAFTRFKNPKIGFIHSDIKKQLMRKKSESYWRLFPFIYKTLEKFIFNKLNQIYVVDQNSFNYYKVKFHKIKERIIYLPTWVDNSVFYPVMQTKLAIKNKILTIDKLSFNNSYWLLFVGRLQEVKAPLRLIRTFAEVKRLHNDSCLIIIGDGNYKKKIKELIKLLNLEDSVFIAGYKSQMEIAQYYRASDVLLLVSNFEAMPRCVLEALGSGLPVVTTEVGGVNQLVYNSYSGEIAANCESDVIAKSVIKVLNNPDVYTKENCIRCVSNYTAERILELIYTGVLKLYSDNVKLYEKMKSPIYGRKESANN